MKKPKSIFYLVYFLFHISLLIVAIYVNHRSEDFEFLLKLRSNMSLMTYVSVAGLILFAINMILVSMEVRNNKQTKEKLENEVNSMKAKMFDLQEASGKKTEETKVVEEKEDKDENTFRDKE